MATGELTKGLMKYEIDEYMPESFEEEIRNPTIKNIVRNKMNEVVDELYEATENTKTLALTNRVDDKATKGAGRRGIKNESRGNERNDHE